MDSAIHFLNNWGLVLYYPMLQKAAEGNDCARIKGKASLSTEYQVIFYQVCYTIASRFDRSSSPSILQ